MGFPVGYTEVFIPSLFIHTLTFLTLIKKLLFTLFHYLGIPPEFLEPDPIPLDPTLLGSGLESDSSRAPPLSAVLLRELLPLAHVPCSRGGEKCAVCMSDFCGGEEIRWLANCKHMFHRDCLDRWMDLDHRTCPLCRTPFLRDHLLHEFNQRLLDAHDDLDDHLHGLDQHFMYVDNYNHTVFSSF